LAPAEFRSLVNTFVDVFPQSTLWHSNPDHVLLIAGLKEISIDFDALSRKLAQPQIAGHLHSSNIRDPYSLIGMLILGPAGLKEYTKDSFLVTDNDPKVEFSRFFTMGLNEPVWSHILNVRAHYINELPEIIRTSNIDDKVTIGRNLKSLEPFINAQLMADPGLKHDEEAIAEYEKALALAPQNANIFYWRAVSLHRMKNQPAQSE
jgi:hypothetical protein